MHFYFPHGLLQSCPARWQMACFSSLPDEPCFPDERNNAMERAITALLILVGIIHLLPLSGILGAERLAALYGIAVQGPDLEILMRHRAVLFGLLGSFMVYAAFKPPLQALAIAGGLVSVVSFIAIAWAV